jgi:hypothetical protein
MRVESPMVVECDTCPVRGVRCDDCVVTVLGHLPVHVLTDGRLPLDRTERRAVGRFVAAGLVTVEEANALVARREPRGHEAEPPTERATAHPTVGDRRAVG